jgi:hypothetical protein
MPMPEAPRMYLIVVCRPFPAAPFVVRRRYLIVVPRLLPAAPLILLQWNRGKVTLAAM